MNGLPTTAGLAAVALFASLTGALVAGCVTVPVAAPPPTKEKLQDADCDVGLAAYQRLLQLPPNAGVVVTGRPAEPPPPEAQEQAAAAFLSLCRGSLVGQARRAIVRCWTDSTDTNTFRGCNDRF